MKYHLFENDLDANYAIGNRIAVDTETMGLDIFNRDRLCAVQLSNGDDDAAIVHFTNTDYNAPNLKKVLSDPNIEKIY
ncbi:MAG: ribonuclease D, partial [Anaplasmataceae bacterium]|nr:ribonuclease D [Anaplasmataceae bacterium]